MASITKRFNTDRSTLVAHWRRKIERLFCVKVFVQVVPDRTLLHEINISGARLDVRNASTYIDALAYNGEIERTTVHLKTLYSEPLIESVEKQSCAVMKKIGPDKYEIRGLKDQLVLAVDLLEEISTETVASRNTSQASKRLATNIQDSITKSNRKMSNCFSASEKVKRAVLGCLNSVDDINMDDNEIKVLHDDEPIVISDSDDDADVFGQSENEKKDFAGKDASLKIIGSPMEFAHHSISKTSKNLQEDAVQTLTSQFQQMQTPSKDTESITGTGNQQSLNIVAIKKTISDKYTLPAYQELKMTKKTFSVQNDQANESVVHIKPIRKETPFSQDSKPTGAHPLVEKVRVCMVRPLDQQSISDNSTNTLIQIHPVGPCNPGETTSVSSASSKQECKDKTCTADRAVEKAKKKLDKTSPKMKEIHDILTMNVRKEDYLEKGQGERAQKTAKRKIELAPRKDVKTVDAFSDRTNVKAKRKAKRKSPKLKEINNLISMNVRHDGSDKTRKEKKVERNIKRQAEMSPSEDKQRACAIVGKLEDKNELESEGIKRRKVAIDDLHYGSEWGTKQDYEINKRYEKPPSMSDRDRKRERKLVKDDYHTKGRSEQLRYIVIDGSNVAMAHGKNKVFSCRGIRICVDFFIKRGHSLITVFLPLWRKCRPRVPGSVTDRYILDDLEDEGVLVYTPSRRIGNKLVAAYDDRFILELAEREDGIVVSNDQYRDLMGEKASWMTLITERLLMYTFARDNFMVPNDPLGRHGPTLDCFLRKTPFQEDAYKFFRDEFKYLNSLYPECPFDRRTADRLTE